MFDCPNCSNHLPDGATFCSQCWQEVSDPSGDAPTTVLPAEGGTQRYEPGADPTVVLGAPAAEVPSAYGPPPSEPPLPAYPPPPSGPPSSSPAPASGPPSGYGPPPTYQPAPPPPGFGPPAYAPQSYAPQGYGPPPAYGPAYGPQPYGAYPGTAPGWGYPAVPHTNGMAIASLILAIVGLMFCGIPSIAAVVFGHIGLHQISRSDGAEQGRGMAIAGLVIGYLVLAAFVAFIVFALTSEP